MFRLVQRIQKGIAKLKLIGLNIKNNAILGNLSLKFFDTEGNVYETIIFAGENGCGKTTLLNIIASSGMRSDFSVGEERTLLFLLSHDESQKIINDTHCYDDGVPILFKYYFKHRDDNNADFHSELFCDMEQKQSFPVSGMRLNKFVYLTPEIQFDSGETRSVTSLELDTYKANNVMVSDSNLARNIVQLLVDINNQDALDFTHLYSTRPSNKYRNEEVRPRVARFNNAFKYIIDDFEIDTIDNSNGRKNIIFLNKGNKVPITNLSSGEKQLVFRGGFLLKDKNVLTGVIALIDEPEISLHPDWQKKIVGFYRNILSDMKGNQTSQIIIATHSPFIIHSDERINDKVYVLKKDKGKVVVLDKPEYYSCGMPSVVADAFNVHFIEEEDKTVFLEGRTDEYYFKKTISAFNLVTQFNYKWIGYIDSNGQERNTGSKALDHAFDFLKARNIGNKYVLFYDCDAKKSPCREGNISVMCAQEYSSTKGMNKGVENALILDSIDTTQFYKKKIKEQDYGCQCEFTEFDKMALCEYICRLDDIEAKKVLMNIKAFIDQIESIDNE